MDKYLVHEILPAASHRKTFAPDGHLLLSVCRGRRDRCLTETGIYRIPLSELV